MKSNQFPWWVARRYLRPSRRDRFLSFITFVAAFGVMLGTCALLVSLSILEGFDRQLNATIVDVTGHCELVTRFGVDSISEAPRVAEMLEQSVDRLDRIAPFVRREAIVRSDVGLEGVLLKGIDPKRDVSKVREYVVDGEFLSERSDPNRLPQLLVGARLAELLGVGPGDSVVLFIADRNPELESIPTIEEFEVAGLYRSGMAGYDDVYVFTMIGEAQQLLGYRSTEVTGFDLLLDDPEQADAVAAEINELLGIPYSAVSIRDLFASIFAWIDLQRLMVPVIMIIIAVVATFNVVSTLLISVIEKSRSIATLSTLGATGSAIGQIFTAKGVLVTLVGLLSGSFLTLIFSILQQNLGLIRLEASIYVFDAVPIAIDPLDYLVVIVGTLLLAILTTLIPARIAAKTRPMSILRLG